MIFEEVVKRIVAALNPSSATVSEDLLAAIDGMSSDEIQNLWDSTMTGIKGGPVFAVTPGLPPEQGEADLSHLCKENGHYIPGDPVHEENRIKIRETIANRAAELGVVLT